MCLKVARLAEEARKRLRGSHFKSLLRRNKMEQGLYWSTVGKVQALSFLASYHMSESHEAACGERTWQQLLRWLVELLVPRAIETDRAIDNTFYPS